MKTILVTSLLSFSLLGCSDEHSRSRGEFLSGCIQGGATKALCSCAYDQLVNIYTADGLSKITKARTSSDIPADYFDNAYKAGITCRTN